MDVERERIAASLSRMSKSLPTAEQRRPHWLMVRPAMKQKLRRRATLLAMAKSRFVATLVQRTEKRPRKTMVAGPSNPARKLIAAGSTAIDDTKIEASATSEPSEDEDAPNSFGELMDEFESSGLAANSNGDPFEDIFTPEETDEDTAKEEQEQQPKPAKNDTGEPGANRDQAATIESGGSSAREKKKTEEKPKEAKRAKKDPGRLLLVLSHLARPLIQQRDKEGAKPLKVSMDDQVLFHLMGNGNVHVPLTVDSNVGKKTNTTTKLPWEIEKPKGAKAMTRPVRDTGANTSHVPAHAPATGS